LPLEGMPLPHDAYDRGEVFERGSVSLLPSTASTTTS
jgi:hypothetical protein